MARRFAAAGYALALAARNPDRLGALVAEIGAAAGTAKAYGSDASVPVLCLSVQARLPAGAVSLVRGTTPRGA